MSSEARGAPARGCSWYWFKNRTFRNWTNQDGRKYLTINYFLHFFSKATVLLTRMLSLWLAKLRNIWNFVTTKQLTFNVRFWQHKCLPCSNVFMMHTRWFILFWTLDSLPCKRAFFVEEKEKPSLKVFFLQCHSS